MAADEAVQAEMTGRLRPGTQLNGVFVIEKLLATGGMGEVYRGHSIASGDQVAIKVIRSDLAHSETALALFRKEASALYKLSHEAIARFFLFSVDPAINRAYLAMEFVGGTSIEDLIAERGAMSVQDVATFARRVASGLEAAHEIGIIHRDISPDNIILADGDVRKAKIIDFGIARTTQVGSNTTVIGGGFAGKYNFVSPEQLGLFDGEIRPTSDIYSLGLVIAAALRGKPLDMSGSQLDIINKRRTVPDLAGIDARFVPLLERMLEPEPARRIQTMAEVADACATMADVRRTQATTTGLKPFEVAPAQSPRPTSASGAPTSKSAASRGLLAGLGALAVVGAGAVAILAWPSAPVVPPKPVPPLLQPAAPGPAPVTLTPGTTPPPAPPQPTAAPKPQPASLEPARPQPPPGDVARIRRFLEEFDGGSCFKLVPVGLQPSSVVIEGLGLSAEPFNKLAAAFRAAFGFSASIDFRAVTPLQCAAVSFLATARFNSALAPRIDINVSELGNGESVAGTARASRDLHLELLLVGDDGFTQNVSNIVRASDQRTFNIRLNRPDSSSPRPQLLMALATTKPLPILKIARPIHADQLFPAVVGATRELAADIGVAFHHVVLRDRQPDAAASAKGRRHGPQVTVATVDGRAEPFQGLNPQDNAFTVVSPQQNPALLWDTSRKEVIVGSDVIAQNVSPDDIPYVVDRLVAVRDVKQMTARSPQPVIITPSGDRHRQGQRLAIEVHDVAKRALVLFSIAGNGKVELLYPIGSDPPVLASSPYRLELVVREPFGADQIVAITAAERMTDIEHALNRLRDWRAAGKVKNILEHYLPADARIGTVGIFTSK